MNNEELLVLYTGRIESMLAKRRDDGIESLWRRLAAMYEQKMTDPDGKCRRSDGDEVFANLMFATIDTIIAGVASRAPSTVVIARNEDSVASAKLAEYAVNDVWRTQNWIEEFRKILVDFLLFGNAVAKVTYSIRSGMAPRSSMSAAIADTKNEDGSPVTKLKKTKDNAEAFDALFEAAYSQAKRILHSTKGINDSNLPRDDAYELFTNTGGAIVVSDTPVLDRVHPEDFLFDLRVSDYKESTWVAQRVRMTRQRARKLWSKNVIDKLPGVSILKTVTPLEKLTEALPSVESLDDMIEVWEFYDLIEGTVCTFHMSTDLSLGNGSALGVWLSKPSEMKYDHGLPFVFRNCFVVPDSPLGMGVAETIEQIIALYNRTVEGLEDDVRAGATKYVARESILDKETRDALEESRPGVVIPIGDDFDGSLTDAIRVMESTQTNPDKWRFENIIKGLVWQMSGVADYQRGGSSLASTATEAAIISQGVSARNAKLLAVIEDMMTTVSEMSIRLMQQYMSLPRRAKLAGRKSGFFPYGRDDLLGQHDVTIEMGSTEPLNERNRREMAQQLMNLVGPFVNSGVVAPEALLRYVLSLGFRVVDPERLFAEGSPVLIDGAGDGKRKGVSGSPGVPIPGPGGEAMPGGQPGGGAPIAPV